MNLSAAALNEVFNSVAGEWGGQGGVGEGRGGGRTPGLSGRICLLECIQSLQVPFNTGPGLVYC